jgi:hypothetical protein
MQEENLNPASQTPETSGQAAASIAEAIRNKRDAAVFSDAEDDESWAAREAALLSDIASFDLDAARQQAIIDAQQIRETRILDQTMVYPEILPEGVAQPEEAKEDAVAQTSATPVLRIDKTGPASVRLLDQLHAQAQTLQDLEAARFRDITQMERKLGKILYRVFSYLHDFAKQLDVIQPIIPRRYSVVDDHAFRDLQWICSFAEYRTLPHSPSNIAESVRLGYQLRSKAQALVIEKDGGVAEAFHQRFFDFGLHVRETEFRTSSRYLERMRFTIRPDIRVGMHWEMDPIQGMLIIRMRNLERLGPTRYFLKPEQVTEDLLERLGRLILGQSESFLH